MIVIFVILATFIITTLTFCIYVDYNKKEWITDTSRFEEEDSHNSYLFRCSSIPKCAVVLTMDRGLLINDANASFSGVAVWLNYLMEIHSTFVAKDVVVFENGLGQNWDFDPESTVLASSLNLIDLFDFEEGEDIQTITASDNLHDNNSKYSVSYIKIPFGTSDELLAIVRVNILPELLYTLVHGYICPNIHSNHKTHKMKLILAISILALAGCQNVQVNYKSNVNSSNSQVNQSTEVSPDVQ